MIRKRVVIHIGQTKTGTTSIQNFLHCNQKQLECSGIHYCDRPCRSTSHRYLFHLMNASVAQPNQAKPRQRHLDRLQEIFGDDCVQNISWYWNYFKQRAFKSSCHTSIISEELLWELGNFNHTSRMQILLLFSKILHEFIDPDDITIVIALRHHAEWLESWHNQMVKDQANQFKVARFFKGELTRGAFAYRKKIDHWKEAFPLASIKVVDFNAQLVSPQPIGLRFLEAAGLTDHLSKQSLLRMIYPERVQKSIHPMLHAFLIRKKPLIRNQNVYKKLIQEADKMIRAKLFELGTKDSFTILNPSIINECNSLHNSDNLSSFGIHQLAHHFDLKRRVPRVLEPEITTYLENKFNRY